jgi:unsaturated chondroitin disaccharide hydrolase
MEQFEDPTAAVIASLAMLSLARLLSDEKIWRIRAHRQISAVIRSRYFTGFMPDSDHKNGSASMFWGGLLSNRTKPGRIGRVGMG